MNTVKFHSLAVLVIAVFTLSCSSKRPFNLVMLPDTQKYADHYPTIFRAQTSWIAANADSIAFVLHQGDIQDNNVDHQWEIAAQAMGLMDGKVPYTFVAGNHDIGPGGSAGNRNTDLMNHYFPYIKYSKEKTFGGAFEEGKMDNTWHTFKAGGLNWLILSLEFAPRNKVLDWAGSIISTFPRHKVIINTHAYMYYDNTRTGSATGQHALPVHYGLGKATGDEAANSGEEMWQKLVSRYPNILMVVSGHILGSGVGTLVSEGIHGNKVYQMLANFQTMTDGSVNGGNGYLRIVTIDTKENRIRVRTYSPFTKQYNTDPRHEFTFDNVAFDE